MGHTNSTANIALPQFIGTDKPTWLGDVNGAFSAIDSKVGTIDADIAATDAKADNAVADAASAVATATSANTTAGNASTTATNALNIANNALTVANNADGHTNQLEMKVGLLADLHTTDKDSIVDAINETFDALPSGGGSVSVTADGVKSYKDLLGELGLLVDFTKIGKNSALVVGSTYCHIGLTDASTTIDFIGEKIDTRYAYRVANDTSSLAKTYDYTSNTLTVISSSIPTSGITFELFY